MSDGKSGKAARMSPLKILVQVMRATGVLKILLGYVAFLLVCALLFCMLEPLTFPTYESAIWCIFQMITTIGFGDVVPKGLVCQIISIVIGLSALLVVGLITGTVVNFFNELMSARRNESFIEFGHKLEHLSELSPEELEDMENEYKAFAAKRR